MEGRTCQECIYFDREKSRGYVLYEYYCTQIKQYLGMKTPACGLFVEAPKRPQALALDHAAECYLTTACVNYKGLADDCKELTLLRQFRDNYIASLENGKELISNYYKYAPSIVEKINTRDDVEKIYNDIYSTILECCNLIESGKNEDTLELYCQMVEKYKLLTSAEV